MRANEGTVSDVRRSRGKVGIKSSQLPYCIWKHKDRPKCTYSKTIVVCFIFFALPFQDGHKNELGCAMAQVVAASLSLWRPGFNPTPVRVWFVVDKLIFREVCLKEDPNFPVSIIPLMLCTLSTITNVIKPQQLTTSLNSTFFQNAGNNVGELTISKPTRPQFQFLLTSKPEIRQV